MSSSFRFQRSMKISRGSFHLSFCASPLPTRKPISNCSWLLLLKSSNHSCLLRWKTHVWECEDGPTTTPTRASEARFILRSWDPVERLVRDAVLSEKEAQLGRMFLHVTHAVQLEF